MIGEREVTADGGSSSAAHHASPVLQLHGNVSEPCFLNGKGGNLKKGRQNVLLCRIASAFRSSFGLSG